MSEIKPEVLDLAKVLKGGMPVAKDGNGTPSENLYTGTLEEGVRKHLPEAVNTALPEGAILEVLNAEQKHRSVFTAAGGLAFGENSLDVMKKNAEVSQTSISIPMIGKDTLNYTFQRERPIPNANGEGTTVKYGSLSTKFDMYGAGSRGQLLKVKQDLAERATAAFGG